MAGVKVIEEVVQKEVKEIVDGDIQFVSLVNHGANRMPFRIVKSEQGETQMPVVLQSLLLPKDIEVKSVSQQKGFEFLNDLKTDAVAEFDTYKKFTQTPLESFNKETLQVLKSGDALFLVGELIETIKDDNAIILSSEIIEKASALDTPVTDPDLAALSGFGVTKFGDLVWSEMMRMEDAVYGLLAQSSSDTKARKKAVMTAINGFKNFMSMGLDVLGSETVSVEKRGSSKEGEDKMFKSKDEMEDFIKETVKAALKENTAEAAEENPSEGEAVAAEKETAEAKSESTGSETAEAKEAPAKKAENPESEDKIGEMTKAMEKMEQTIKSMTEKQENLSQQLSTQSAAEKSETQDAEPVKKSVFSGLLTKK